MGRHRAFPTAAVLIEVLRAEPTLTQAQLAERYGVAMVTVKQNCQKAGVALACSRRRVATVKGKPIVSEKSAGVVELEIAKLVDADPNVTAVDIQSRLGISPQKTHRALKAAGVKLRAAHRKLPADDILSEEIKELGVKGVARKHQVAQPSVRAHAVRLGLAEAKVVGKPSSNRLLPPDDVLMHEFDLFTPGEIAQRHKVSYQSVLEASWRLGVRGRSARSTHALIPSGMTSIIANAIAHLHAYRSAMAEFKPDRAKALLADIEQLGVVATTIRTISSMVAEPKAEGA